MSKIFVDQIGERTSGNKITLNNTLKVDAIEPKTSGGGISISTHLLTTNRPAFLAKKLGGSNVNSGSRVDFETIVINVGDGYKLTGGDAYKFICPVAGLYQLQTQCLSTNNASANDIDMYINAALHQRVRQDVSAAAHNTLNMSTIANLSVGDAVYIYVSGGAISAAGSQYTSFSGYLIG